MWAKWSPGSVGTNPKAILECVPKQPTYLENCYHPVLVIDHSKEALEGLVEKVAKVINSREAMLHTMVEDRSEIAARLILRAIGLTAKGK
jgi:hypothetical protein